MMKVARKITSEHFDYTHQESWYFESGNHQSPIELTTAEVEKYQSKQGGIQLSFADNCCAVHDTGNAIQVEASARAFINGRYFDLDQFHFHAKGEHVIDGNVAPVEAHFVYQHPNGALAVIAIFMEIGDFNQTFQQILSCVATEQVNTLLDLRELFPSNLSYYHYIGSLTTPPLTENVEWYLIKQPIEISSSQAERFFQFYSDNHRHVQPLHGRHVLDFEE